MLSFPFEESGNCQSCYRCGKLSHVVSDYTKGMYMNCKKKKSPLGYNVVLKVSTSLIPSRAKKYSIFELSRFNPNAYHYLLRKKKEQKIKATVS